MEEPSVFSCSARPMSLYDAHFILNTWHENQSNGFVHQQHTVKKSRLTYGSITTTRGKGAVARMKRNAIHRIHGISLTMAFEGIAFHLGG